MRAILGLTIGLLIVYLFNSALAWDLNPGEWGGFLRFWGLGWALVWGGAGLMIGMEKDDDAKAAKRRRQTHPSQVIIDQ